MRSARSYQREIANLKAMMQDMLWVQPTYNGSPSCSYCGEQQHLHTEHCEATLLLRAPLATEDDDEDTQ